jgi:hypothetical protein
MITPDQIRRKAENLYPAWLEAWLRGEPFFPKLIPADRRIDSDIVKARDEIAWLRRESREEKGFGYTVEWQERSSRTHGRNLFPERITFETDSDFLRFLGRERDFSAFGDAVAKIRKRHPALEEWIRSHRKAVADIAPEIDGLLEVVAYLSEHPRPEVFARELPLRVDTKFVERHRQILREWLDLVLPYHTIRSAEDHFERRFGLRYAEPHILIRFLDPALQRLCSSPWAECSLPLTALANLPIDSCRVVIVENKVNLLTLPVLSSTLALGGLGNGVVDLRDISWLARCAVWYWGDVDVEGFWILSRLRVFLPGAKSVMMDESTFDQLRGTTTSAGSGAKTSLPPNLTATESAAFLRCATENLRIEQERIRQDIVLARLEGGGDL